MAGLFSSNVCSSKEAQTSGNIGFFSCLFEDDFAKNDTHGDFHDDVYIYVNRDFNKVDKVHYEFGAFIESTMRMIL